MIVDAKYNKRYGQEQARKKGIGLADLYQLVSYALRRECPRAVLLYLAADVKVPAEPQRFTVNLELMLANKIELWAADVPVLGAMDNEAGVSAQLKSSLRELLGKVLGNLPDPRL